MPFRPVSGARKGHLRRPGGAVPKVSLPSAGAGDRFLPFGPAVHFSRCGGARSLQNRVVRGRDGEPLRSGAQDRPPVGCRTWFAREAWSEAEGRTASCPVRQKSCDVTLSEGLRKVYSSRRVSESASGLVGGSGNVMGGVVRISVATSFPFSKVSLRKGSCIHAL